MGPESPMTNLPPELDKLEAAGLALFAEHGTAPIVTYQLLIGLLEGAAHNTNSYTFGHRRLQLPKPLTPRSHLRPTTNCPTPNFDSSLQPHTRLFYASESFSKYDST